MPPPAPSWARSFREHQGTVIGAVVGWPGGAGYAAETKDVDIVLPRCAYPGDDQRACDSYRQQVTISKFSSLKHRRRTWVGHTDHPPAVFCMAAPVPLIPRRGDLTGVPWR